MRLLEWENLSLLMRGERLESFVAAEMARQGAPIENLRLRFAPGELRVSGKVRAVVPFPVPFEIVVRNIVARGRTLRVHLESAAAFGILPIPRLLLRFAQAKVARDGIELNAETSTVLVSLDRFLPSFVDVDVEEVRIVAEGLALRVGPGGADPPQNPGG